jgi:hypothetical protein
LVVLLDFADDVAAANVGPTVVKQPNSAAADGIA